MSKRGNYFIAVYDKNDNNVMEFESIQECANYFNFTKDNISKYIRELRRIKNEFLLLKINDNCEPIDNLSKSL